MTKAYFDFTVTRMALQLDDNVNFDGIGTGHVVVYSGSQAAGRETLQHCSLVAAVSSVGVYRAQVQFPRPILSPATHNQITYNLYW